MVPSSYPLYHNKQNTTMLYKTTSDNTSVPLLQTYTTNKHAISKQNAQ